MKVLLFILLAAIGYAAEPASEPLHIPESYRRFAELIEALYTTKDLTFKQACDKVTPMADEMRALDQDPRAPNLLYLVTQAPVFIAEEARLEKLSKMNRGNEELKQAWLMMWSLSNSYRSFFFRQGDYTILNSTHRISRFFNILPTPRTEIFSLHIHKLLFLMYINEFLCSISDIITDEVGFFKPEDDDKRFLEVIDPYFRASIIECGITIFEHAVWILREHVEYVADKEEAA
ncbi:MAG: hypothetical protein Q8K36_07120 [Alphaproteobacteria bacterium]|nr:hypothetical protein [Alphaproteobacteria bacterium]